jgi:hypothetical protein
MDKTIMKAPTLKEIFEGLRNTENDYKRLEEEYQDPFKTPRGKVYQVRKYYLDEKVKYYLEHLNNFGQNHTIFRVIYNKDKARFQVYFCSPLIWDDIKLYISEVIKGKIEGVDIINTGQSRKLKENRN